MKMADGLSDADNALLEEVQTAIDAGDLWDLDRRVAMAMESLRCPPNDALLSVLSGGERRRVALARLLLENHGENRAAGVRARQRCLETRRQSPPHPPPRPSPLPH
jgi:hypothetical protein